LGTYPNFFYKGDIIIVMYLYLEHGQSVQYFARQFSFAGCQVLNRIASYKFWVSHSHPTSPIMGKFSL